MLITYIRSSSLANYSFCQQQYFLNYVLGIPRTAGLKAAKGTTVHKVLECLALLKLEKQRRESDHPLNLCIHDDTVGDISIKNDLLGSKETTNLLINLAFEYYSKKDGNNFSKKDFNEIEKWVYDVLWYKDGMFDPRQRIIVAAEPHFDIEINRPWAEYEYKIKDEMIRGNLSIKGTVDLITKIDDKTIEIIDWKTGQRKDWATGEEKTYDKLCSDPQLMLYYYAASKMYPWAEQIIITIFYVKYGGPFTICFEAKHIAEMEKILEQKFKDIKANTLPKMVSANQTDFKCTRICDYYKNKWEGTNCNQCMFIHKKIKQHGIDYVTENFSQDNHDISHYQNPGE